MSDTLRYDQDGHTLILNQPETRNALTDRDMVEASSPLANASGPIFPCARLILTGAGPAFSSGGNLKHMRDRVGTFGGDAATVRDNYRKGIQRIPRVL